MGKNVPKLRFKGFEGEWEEKKIGDITLKVGSGKTPRGGNSVYTDSGVMFLRSQNVFNGYMVLDDVAYITEEENNKMKSTSVYENDILLNITGASIGRCCVVPNLNNKANVNQHVCIIRPKKDTNSSFIMNQIIGYKVQRQIDSYQAGGNREGLNFQQIKEIKINIPSLQEQEKIANLLSKVDRYIELQEKKVSELEKYKKGMMQKIFSQKIRFRKDDGGEYPEWEEKKISSLFDVFAGGDISKEHLASDFDDKYKYPVYANTLANKGLYGYSDMYKFKEGTITVTGRGNIGVANARYTKYYPIVRLLVLVPKGNCNIKFFEEIINNTKIFMESTGVPQLTGPQISSIKVKNCCLAEQEKIANFFSKIDLLIEKQTKRLEELKIWKNGLLQKMFV